MNSRERVIRAIEFAGPDRVPIIHRTLPGAFRVHGEALETLYERYPSDVMLSPTRRAPFAFGGQIGEGLVGERVIDEWGCEWQKATDDYIGQVVVHPLSNWDALDHYVWPDPLRGREGLDEMVEVMRADRHEHYFMATAGTLMHRITFLRGFENALLDLAEGREEFTYLLDRIADFMLKRIELWTQAGADGILIEDDWGTQNALMIRPDVWRTIFRPVYSRLVLEIHAGGAYAHFHTDGVTLDIIPDLIEIGFDELNPQVWIMDVSELSRKFSGRVCFRADLDRQHVLPHGTPDEVAEHVRLTYAAFGGPEGGYIGYGQIGPDVPLANAEAMLRTFMALHQDPHFGGEL